MDSRMPARHGNDYGPVHVGPGGYLHQGDIVGQQPATLTKEQQCCQTFKTSSYEDHKDRNPARVPETCRWVLDHPHFREWRAKPDHTVLWISADPGCGKSVLSKTLVDEILPSDDIRTVCYFFFKDNEEQDNLATALCALLHQLFSSQPRLLRHAIPAWERNGDKLRNETQEMWRILRAAAIDPEARPVICVLDALDECKDADRERLIQLLCALQQDNPRTRVVSSFKVLVTSRPYDNVQRWFRDAADEWPSIRLRGEDENDIINQEINLVVEQHVQKLRGEFDLPDSLSDRILYTLQKMEHRTYLWLRLAMEEMRKECRDNPIRDEIGIISLPKSVDAAYESILGRVEETQRDLVCLILLVIIGARRPLSLEEMAQALSAAYAAERGLSTLTRTRFEPKWLRERIPELCGHFVFIKDSQLFLIHQTAKEFLLAQEGSLRPSPPPWKACLPANHIECEMTSICVTYLHLSYADSRSRHLSGQGSRACSVLPSDFRRDSFGQYCAEYWTQHLTEEATLRKSYLLSQVMSLFQTDTDLFNRWFPALWRAQGRINSFHPPGDFLPQHVIAMTGHTFALQQMLDSDDSNILLDAEDNKGATALIYATQHGHQAVIRLLLDHGANVYTRGVHGTNALHVASRAGTEAVVRLLLDHGADFNAQGGQYGTALRVASSEGKETVVRLLLEYGADIDAQITYCGNALHAASRSGHEAVVRLLLNHGANIDAQVRPFGNALQIASMHGKEAVVRVLLDHGADINAHGGDYGTALQIASWDGYEAVVRLLLDHGADINAQGRNYRRGTALQIASGKGHEAVVRLLLDHGADFNATGKYYNNEREAFVEGNALQAASSNGHESVVRLLRAHIAKSSTAK